MCHLRLIPAETQSAHHWATDGLEGQWKQTGTVECSLSVEEIATWKSPRIHQSSQSAEPFAKGFIRRCPPMSTPARAVRSISKWCRSFPTRLSLTAHSAADSCAKSLAQWAFRSRAAGSTRTTAAQAHRSRQVRPTRRTARPVLAMKARQAQAQGRAQMARASQTRHHLTSHLRRRPQTARRRKPKRLASYPQETS